MGRVGGWHQLAKMAAAIARKGERVQKAASAHCVVLRTRFPYFSPLPFSGKAGRAREQKSERTDEEERETSPPKVVVEKASGGKGREEGDFSPAEYKSGRLRVGERKEVAVLS